MKSEGRLSWKAQLEEENWPHEKVGNANNHHYLIVFLFNMMHRNHSDVAFEYLCVAFVAQGVSKTAKILSIEESIPDPHTLNVEFRVACSSPSELERILTWLQFLFDHDECDEGNSCEYSSSGENVQDAFMEFRESIEAHRIMAAAPDYCDLYFANWLGSSYDWDEEAIRHAKRENPEWIFHTWKSTWSETLQINLYVSGDFWIMETDAELSRAWVCSNDYRPSENNTLLIPKYTVSDMDYLYLSTGSDIIRLPLWMYMRARECASLVFPESFNRELLLEERRYDSPRFMVSEDLAFLTFASEKSRCVLFRESYEVLTVMEIDRAIPTSQGLLADLMEKGSGSMKRTCRWDSIND